MSTITEEPKIFITDYASYNQGTQMEFGHYVNLTDFNDETDFLEYIEKHFKEADEQSPLESGEAREEIMFTDFEGFPRELYGESMNEEDLRKLFEWVNLEDNEKISVAFMIEQNCDFNYAIDNHSKVTLREFNRYGQDKYFVFEEYYPESADVDAKNSYITIDYDAFIDNEFTEFEYDGISYLIHESWNH